jgi:sterol desaturase/sphingolipid hydroxylase (fatty acid hydroxylase superfamily)
MLLPFFLFAALLTALEAWITRGRGIYQWRETENSLGLAAGWLATTLLFAPLIAFSYAFTSRHVLVNLGSGVAGNVFLFLLYDLLFYFYHRLSHRFRVLWASHVVHHTAAQMNVLAGFRQGWTDFFSGLWLIALILGFLGATPLLLEAYFLATLFFQLWLHSEWIGNTGPIEWIFNTPCHHRVHHSRESRQMNANYGQIFILWDRLFGTFVAEGADRITAFGLEKMPPADAGPVAIALGEWQALFRDLRRGAAGRQGADEASTRP